MLADAAKIARIVSPGYVRIEPEDAILACLKTLDGQQVFWTDGLANPGDPTTFTIDRIREAFRDAISDMIERSPDIAADKRAWFEEIDKLRLIPIFAVPNPNAVPRLGMFATSLRETLRCQHHGRVQS